MKRFAITMFALWCAMSAAVAAPVTGDWFGVLDLGVAKLRLAVHVQDGGNGGYKATMDSLDQGAKGIAVDSFTLAAGVVTFKMAALNAQYEGKIAADGKQIAGTFTQHGQAKPLLLSRDSGVLAVAAPKRPQTPQRPFPYREEDVAYANPAAGGIVLAGTLSLPQGAGPFPAVLLVAGSGPHARDGEILHHKIMLLWSDYLTRRGFAVLRTDKRGIAKSQGSYREATTADFASDASAAVAYLRTRPDIDAGKIGVLGHSEGGSIAPIVAGNDARLAFAVLLAAPAESGRKILMDQSRLIALANGAKPDNVARDQAKREKILAAVVAESDVPKLETALRQIEADASGRKLEEIKDAEIKPHTTPWMRAFAAYDPAPALRKVHCPVLAINGALDLQVPVGNLKVIESALADNKRSKIVALPDLNHLLQTSKTGSPAEYGAIEETVAPQVLALVAGWMREQVQ
ncbi:MAG TPA: alpha/beta fold hydrolase [Burkholderiaceae bacterium]